MRYEILEVHVMSSRASCSQQATFKAKPWLLWLLVLGAEGATHALHLGEQQGPPQRPFSFGINGSSHANHPAVHAGVLIPKAAGTLRTADGEVWEFPFARWQQE